VGAWHKINFSCYSAHRVLFGEKNKMSFLPFYLNDKTYTLVLEIGGEKSKNITCICGAFSYGIPDTILLL
jgi:hypothetical protein